DITSTLGQRATALLRTLSEPGDPAIASALQRLKTWDHRANRESVGAAIFNVWFHEHLRKAVVKRLFPADAAKAIGSGAIQNVLAVLEHPSERFGAQGHAIRDELMLAALSAAVSDLT